MNGVPPWRAAPAALDWIGLERAVRRESWRGTWRHGLRAPRELLDGEHGAVATGEVLENGLARACSAEDVLRGVRREIRGAPHGFEVKRRVYEYGALDFAASDCQDLVPDRLLGEHGAVATGEVLENVRQKTERLRERPSPMRTVKGT